MEKTIFLSLVGTLLVMLAIGYSRYAYKLSKSNIESLMRAVAYEESASRRVIALYIWKRRSVSFLIVDLNAINSQLIRDFLQRTFNYNLILGSQSAMADVFLDMLISHEIKMFKEKAYFYFMASQREIAVSCVKDGLEFIETFSNQTNRELFLDKFMVFALSADELN